LHLFEIIKPSRKFGWDIKDCICIVVKMRTKLNPPPKEKKKKKKGKSQKGIKMTAGIEKVHVLHPKII
jgi:hypothetical protein